jgi:magnesium-transporting ATPase (P-type)
MATTYKDGIPAWYWLAAGLGLLWSLVGVAFYLGSVGVLSGPFAVPPGQPEMPLWATTAFAISVWGSVLAAVGLLMRKRWARSLLWLAFVAVVVDFSWVFFVSGAGVTPLGVTVIVVALLLALLGETAAKRGWLR